MLVKQWNETQEQALKDLKIEALRQAQKACVRASHFALLAAEWQVPERAGASIAAGDRPSHRTKRFIAHQAGEQRGSLAMGINAELSQLTQSLPCIQNKHALTACNSGSGIQAQGTG